MAARWTSGCGRLILMPDGSAKRFATQLCTPCDSQEQITFSKSGLTPMQRGHVQH